ncbi:MAG TPA: hypothetical protein VH186_14050 [Chloroflexia bacterium]|nr:hypothetical protein [Chloroflexia bacterium]
MPGQIKLLFVEEYGCYQGKSFYRGNSLLFQRTREAFARAYNTGLENKKDFFDLFVRQGCYVISMNGFYRQGVEAEEREKQRKEGIALLGQRLAEYRPEQVIVVMAGLKKHVDEALKLAGLEKNASLHVVPFPTKEYAAEYTDKLVRILKD